MRNNNYTKDPSESSSKYGELLFDKERDIFKEEDFSMTESEVSKFNQRLTVTNKKQNCQKVFSSGMSHKKHHKKKLI